MTGNVKGIFVRMPKRVHGAGKVTLTGLSMALTIRGVRRPSRAMGIWPNRKLLSHLEFMREVATHPKQGKSSATQSQKKSTKRRLYCLSPPPRSSAP